MAYSIKGLPWQYKGSKDVTRCRTSAEVIEAAQLNWEVRDGGEDATISRYGQKS